MRCTLPSIRRPILLSNQIFNISNSFKLCENLIPTWGITKLVFRPYSMKINIEFPTFLKWIHRDICGRIPSPCGPFHYLMVSIDVSSKWSNVCLFSMRYVTFARLLVEIIKLQAQFLDCSIKTIHLDNTGEFISQTFDAYLVHQLGLKLNI